eukprot:RCo010417
MRHSPYPVHGNRVAGPKRQSELWDEQQTVARPIPVVYGDATADPYHAERYELLARRRDGVELHPSAAVEISESPFQLNIEEHDVSEVVDKVALRNQAEAKVLASSWSPAELRSALQTVGVAQLLGARLSAQCYCHILGLLLCARRHGQLVDWYEGLSSR